MKKLFVSALAILGLVACVKDDVVSVQDNRSAIGFSTFVENATRAGDPSLTTDNIQEFSVWAYMNNADGVVFNDELVSRSGDAWTYTNLQYWLVGNDYTFAAFAGDRADVTGLPEGIAMSDEGLGVINFTNVKGTNDILFAAATVTSAKADQEAVNIQFDHLLSKVKFSFKNGFANTNTTVAVKDITMTAPSTGSVNLAVAAYDDNNNNTPYVWTRGAEAVTLNFGHMNGGNRIAIADGAKESDDQRLTIPTGADYEYTVKFTVEVYNGTEMGLERPMEVKLSGIEFIAGHAYNLVATINQENLNLNAIEFTVNVDEWIEENVDGGAVEGEVTFVNSANEIQTILDAATTDVTIIFGDDIKGDVTILQKENIDVTINGNGKKFDGVFTVNGNARSAGAETLTFTGINFESKEAKTFINAPSKINNRYNYSHNVTIENCTFTGAYDQGVEVGSASFTGAYNIVMKNCAANNMHSLLQTQSVDNKVLVENVKVINCKNGVSFGNTAYPTLRNANIDAECYGVRADGNASRGDLVIEESTIEANQPVVVRKVTTKGYRVNVDAASTLTTTGDYHVIFTQGSDDAAYVAPTVDFTYNGSANHLVFPNVIVAHNAETLAAALMADVKNINVMLADDIDLPINTLGQQTGGSGEYKLGGENTETITIDLNDNRLNVTTTYWSVLGAKNNDALFTIKNGTMTSSQATGTWNSYDLCFANCNYNLEDVVFEKAIALEAANKAYNLTKVTINETHDYYAMWISAKGQNITIDGLTIKSNGRGIKIDEQYVSAPAKVTLNIANSTFKTVNKAAIIVKSVAGAEINVENIDITNVAADNEFAVWVDEDSKAYADKVVVNGALVKVEGATDVVVSTADELAEAINNGSKKVYLENGSYTLASYPAGIELVGYGDNVVLDVKGKKYGVNGNVTIENVKLVFSNANYTGFQHTDVEVYKNCTIVGQPFLYGNNITFEGCTFEQTSSDAYNVWTYGAKNVKFVNCVFNSAGKSVLIYTESGNGQNATFVDCTMNASVPVTGKAAIEIDSSLISGQFNVVINNTTADGFANGSVSGNSLWNNKKGTKTTVTVDGVQVL